MCYRPEEPEQCLGGRPALLVLFTLDHLFEGLGGGRVSSLPCLDLGDVASQVTLDDPEGLGAK